MADKSVFKTGIKSVRTATLHDSVQKMKEEKKPVDLVKALGLKELSDVKE